MSRPLLLTLLIVFGSYATPAYAQQGRAWAGEPPAYARGRELPPALVQSLKAMPDGGRFRLDELVRYTVGHGRITARFTLPADLDRLVAAEAAHGGSVRLTVEGSDQVWTLQRSPPRRAGAGYRGAPSTELTCYAPGGPGQFQCAALAVSDTGTMFRGFDFPTPGGLGRDHLSVAIRGAGDVALAWRLPQGDPARQRVADLPAFEEKYPEVWRTAFLPVARRLGAGHLLHRRPAADVYRAFPEVRPDDATARRVDDLAASVDSPDFAERDAADRALRAMGRPAIACLLRAERGSLSPEQVARVDALVADDDWRRVRDPAAARQDLLFLLDCLDDDDVAVRRAAVGAVGQVLGTSFTFDVNQIPEARRVAVDALCEQAHDARRLAESVRRLGS